MIALLLHAVQTAAPAQQTLVVEATEHLAGQLAPSDWATLLRCIMTQVSTTLARLSLAPQSGSDLGALLRVLHRTVQGLTVRQHRTILRRVSLRLTGLLAGTIQVSTHAQRSKYVKETRMSL